MLVLVGQATRLQRYLVGLPKAYRVRARFGVTSTTGDPTGELSVTGGRTSEDAVRQALEPLTGEIRQRVPAYSAVKVEGVRLYKRARAGEEVELPERTVRIDRLELIGFDEAIPGGGPGGGVLERHLRAPARGGPRRAVRRRRALHRAGAHPCGALRAGGRRPGADASRCPSALRSCRSGP